MVSAVVIFSFVFLIVANPAVARKNETKLGVGDHIVVRVPAEPNLGGEFRIDANGDLYLNIIEGLDLGAVNVVGKSTSEVEEELMQRLSRYYEDPEVTVQLLSFGLRPQSEVSIFGKVNASGSFAYQEGISLLDLLVDAGGLAEDADLTSISLYREDEPVRYLDIRDLIEGRSSEGNIYLEEGDYIIVPGIRPAMQIKVMVIGKVAQTGSVYLPEDARVLDVLAEAGGAQGRAAVGKSYIIRVEDGKPVVLHSDIKALINGADISQNIQMKDGDVLFIPETNRVDIMKVVNDLLDLNLLKNVVEDDY